MAKASVLFKVYPKDPEQVDKTMDSIKSAMDPVGMQMQDVAFGIKVIKVLFVMEDASVGSSGLEERLKKVAGVGEVEVEEESLL
ncbi:MAG: elongation factor 1-beta family protein [Candidatus Marsarchaeota archaeon]|jgi:translation elongation factor EF-1beta|nr:elongation factor 1-beta family protein [Candidatus Marsarchaeota archaeon]